MGGYPQRDTIQKRSVHIYDHIFQNYTSITEKVNLHIRIDIFEEVSTRNR